MAFEKGQSGNPAGRPPGLPDKRSQLRALLDPYRQALVEKAVEVALGGDTQALRLCIERLIPPMRNRDIPMEIQVSGETLTERAESVLNLGESGQLSVTELSSLMQMVSTMARIIDVDDLERRVAALEQTD